MRPGDLWPILAVLVVVAGILVGERLGPSPAVPLLVVAVLFAAVALFSPRRAVLVGCALALLAAGCTQRALHGVAVSPVTDAVESRAWGRISGDLVGDPETRPYSARVRVRVEHARLDGQPTRVDRTVVVRASGDAAMRLGVLEAGDEVVLDGAFEPLDGWDRRERWNHAVGMFRAEELLAFSAPSSPLWRVANALRRRVLDGLDALPRVDRALAASFLLGDDRDVPRSVEDEFRAAGMTHLLVVSGSNVAFALALCAPVLRRLGLRWRVVAGLGVLVVFATMTRWEPSVLRATVMTGLAMTGLLLGRPTTGIRVLALAVTAILLADPFLLHSIGFQLSCGATAGIALLGEPIATRMRGPRWWRDAFAATAAAQIGVAPVLVAVFDGVPLASLPANVLAVPPAAFVTVAGLVTGVVGGIVDAHLPLLASLLAAPVGAVLRYEREVAALAARMPIELSAVPLVLLGALVALVLVARRARRLRRDEHVAPG